MADSKVSGLPLAASFLATHELPVNESGVSKKVTGAQIQASVAQGTLPGGYQQVVAVQGPYTALTDLTGLSVTVTVAAGRRIRVSGFAAQNSSVATDTIGLSIRDGSNNTLMFLDWALSATGGSFGGVISVVLVPGAGTFTYKLSGQRVAGTGNINTAAGATAPAWILAEDIGT